MTAYGDLRVADFTTTVAGAMGAMLLGDLGADVVRIEAPGSGRNALPGFVAFNRNKQVLTLDIQTESGMAEAGRLLAGADVAIFDWSPRRMAELRLTSDELTGRHPSLIHAWAPPYGTEEPWCELPPHHGLLAGLAGWGWRQAGAGDDPIHQVIPAAWYGQASMTAAAVGAALFERGRSGLGQGLIVSGLHGFAEVGGPCRILNEAPIPRSIPLGVNPRYRLYRCGDGRFFFLGSLFPNFYRKVFEALDMGDAADLLMADDEGAKTLLDEIFATRSCEHWVGVLQAAGVPCAPVGAREAWFDSDTIRRSGLRLSFEHPELGQVDMPGPPVSLSETPARVAGLALPLAEAPDWSPRAADAKAAPRRAPLAGVRVLNLGTVIAGAYPGAILSSLGADVVKIEPPEGDPFRYDPTFLGFNRGTRALALDLKEPDGVAAFIDLVRQADVVIDNYRYGVRDRLGIGYAALKAVNPRIISCSITAYGDSGPRAPRPGFDPLFQAEGGMMAAQGGRGDPVFLTIGMNDVATAGMVTSSIIAALNARERTGVGQEVRTSLMAMSLHFQLGELVAYAGRAPNAEGGWECVGLGALHRYYACADGWIGVACERAEEAVALGRVLGVDLGESALTAPRDGDLAVRLAGQLATLERAPLLDALRAAGVAAAPAIRTPEVFSDDWLGRSRYLERWEHPTRGPVLSARNYAEFLATPSGFLRPAPLLGEHSQKVLEDYGFAPERIASLVGKPA